MKDIFFELLKANTNDEVSSVVNKYTVFRNPNNWKPYGGITGNFGTFESQQNHPVPALIEKITNSIDAILIKECKLRGIDPKSQEAPKSMKEAVRLFYNVRDGEIGELDRKSRRELAKNIQVLACGDKKQPSVLIYDNGEGQEPENFTNTFLSLHQNNKMNIHFVQGKYNMGATGAVVFCGENKYQLVGSKKQPSLNADSRFGFTLIRRHPLTREEEEYKATWYEYFFPESQIPAFDIDEIDLGLKGTKFTAGSLVKLYSYQFPRGSRSNITLDLWRDLNQFMFHLPLPILLYEKRDYRGNTPDKLLLGNRTRITIDDRDKVDEIIPFQIPENSEVGKVNIETIIFKPDVDHNEFIKNKSIIFTLNGQVQGFQGQSFISQELGFSLLKKHMLIHVDCTYIPTDIRQDLFMSNRTHLKQGPKTEMLRDKIIDILRKSDRLREINNERKNNIFINSDDDKALITDLLSKLPVDKDVLNVLQKDGSLDFLKKVGYRIKSTSKDKKTQKELNRFPSIFRIKHSKNGKLYKTIPINHHGKVEIETDVSDDYLFRPYDKGNLHIEILQKRKKTDTPVKEPNPNPNDVTDIVTIEREGPNNGNIKLLIKPTSKARVGDEVKIKATLTSPGEEMSCVFTVKVDEKISSPHSTTPKKTETFPNLPTPQKAFENPKDGNGVSWKELNWTGYDIVKIVSDKDDETNELLVSGIVVNMDAFVFKKFISKNRIKTEKELKYMSNKFFLSVYLHSLFLYSILQKMRKDDAKLEPIEIDEFVSSMIKPYASFLLYENYHVTKLAFD